jgi:hypothetical protein
MFLILHVTNNVTRKRNHMVSFFPHFRLGIYFRFIQKFYKTIVCTIRIVVIGLISTFHNNIILLLNYLEFCFITVGSGIFRFCLFSIYFPIQLLRSSPHLTHFHIRRKLSIWQSAFLCPSKLFSKHRPSWDMTQTPTGGHQLQSGT